MKNTTLVLILLITIFTSSCIDQKPCELEYEELTEDVYIPGYAILLATSKNETGIIKINTSDPHIMKGVLFQYTNNVQFNVYEDIQFKIRQVGGLQQAYDIMPLDSKTKQSDADQIADRITMNLHNAVIKGFEHPENMVHKWGHRQDEGTLFRLDGEMEYRDSSDPNAPSTIDYGTETYIKYKLCYEETIQDTIYMVCDDFYVRGSMKEEIESKTDNFLFNSIEVEINNVMRNIVIDIINEHIHFGDRVPFKR